MISASAQEEGETEINNPVIRISSNTVYGKVVDPASKGVAAVSIQLFAGAANDSLVAAMLTRTNGDFRFSKLPAADSFRILISAVGFAAKEQYLSFAAAGRDASFNNEPLQKDLGNIFLQQDVQTLSSVVVTAQRPGLVMGIDRRIFNVDKSLTATDGRCHEKYSFCNR